MLGQPSSQVPQNNLELINSQREIDFSQPESLSTNDNAFDFYEQVQSEHFSYLQKEFQNEDHRQGSSLFNMLSNPSLNIRQGHPDDFKELFDNMKTGDFSSLKTVWGPKLANKIKFIGDNWSVFSMSYKESIIEEYLVHCKKHFEIFNINSEELLGDLFQNIYPEFRKTNKMLEKATQIKCPSGSESRNSSSSWSSSTIPQQMVMNNVAFRSFAREQEAKNNKAGGCFIEVKDKNEQQNVEGVPQRKPEQKFQSRIALGDYIVEKGLFSQNESDWRKILFQAIVAIRYNTAVLKHSEIKKQVEEIFQFSQLSLDNHELTQPSLKLCCSKFFYIHHNICPNDNHNLLYREKLFQLKEKEVKKKNKKNEESKKSNAEPANPKEIQDIMTDICALLNSGGGVLLFNCKKVYLDVRPIGQSFIEEQKQRYTFVIKEALRKIYPKVSSKKQIKISFVPCVKNPYEQGYKRSTIDEEDRRVNRQYIPGLYIMRITVTPTKPEMLYFYDSGRQEIRTSILEKGKRKELKGKQLVEVMEKNFNFFAFEEEDQEQAMLLGKDFTSTELHKCSEPYPGVPIHEKDIPVPPPNPAEKFAYVSFLVANSKNYRQIENKLKQKGIDCWINDSFTKYEFNSAQGSAAIHHNIRYNYLLAEMAYKPEFKFDNRFVLLINVTYCLKLKEREEALPLQDARRLEDWLHKEFPNQTLEYWLFDNSQQGKTGFSQEHFIRTGSQLSIVFLYHYLHQRKEKLAFKNPAVSGIEDKALYREQVNKRMKRLYSEDKSPFFKGDCKTPE